MTIALDVFGGDFAPKIQISAAVQARKLGLDLVLVGDTEIIKQELALLSEDPANYTIEHSESVISMDDIIDSNTLKKKSSIRVCYTLLRDKRVDAVVSAGNSGAMLALGKMIVKTIDWVDRPCIGTLMPAKGGFVMLADAGANADCTPENLFQFAVLANCYLETVMKISKPRIALLNIGEEEGKGNQMVRKAFDLIKASRLNFVGNVEGKEFFSGKQDAVICDGFTGNILLKSVQGAAKFLTHLFKTEYKRNFITKLLGLTNYGVFKRVGAQASYAKFGGGALMGLKGIAIVCHGESSTEAMISALKLADWATKNKLIESIEQAAIKFNSAPVT